MWSGAQCRRRAAVMSRFISCFDLARYINLRRRRRRRRRGVRSDWSTHGGRAARPVRLVTVHTSSAPRPARNALLNSTAREEPPPSLRRPDSRDVDPLRQSVNQSINNNNLPVGATSPSCAFRLRMLPDAVRHTMRKQGSCPEKDIMQGTMPGACTAWVDNIKTRTGLSVEESVRMTKDRDKWRSTSVVWPTLGSRTAKEQNRRNHGGKSWRGPHVRECRSPSLSSSVSSPSLVIVPPMF